MDHRKGPPQSLDSENQENVSKTEQIMLCSLALGFCRFTSRFSQFSQFNLAIAEVL